MALIAVILGQTERIRVFPDVANLPLRPPAMLAKQAATLDQLSGGRFELGLGAGAFWDAIRAMGGPVRTPGEAIGALREAIAIIRAYWSGQSCVRRSAATTRCVGARPGPLPAHDMRLWLGVVGPRALRLTGELGDGWIPSMSYVPPATGDRSPTRSSMRRRRWPGAIPPRSAASTTSAGMSRRSIEAGVSDEDPADRRTDHPLGQCPDPSRDRCRLLDLHPLGCADRAPAADVHRGDRTGRPGAGRRSARESATRVSGRGRSPRYRPVTAAPGSITNKSTKGTKRNRLSRLGAQPVARSRT